MNIVQVLNRLREIKYVGSTLWMFVDRFIGVVTGIIVGAAVARYLGVVQFGVISYAITIVAILSPLYSLGLGSILTRDLVRFPQRTNVLIGSAFFLQLCGSFVVFLVLFGSVLYSRKIGDAELVLLFLSLGILFEPFQVIVSYNRATVSQNYTAWASICSQILKATLQIFFIFNKLPIIYFAAAILIEKITRNLLLVIIYYYKKGSVCQWRVSRNTISNLLKASWSLLLTGIASILFLKIDQLMLKSLTGIASLGIYSAAVRISELFYIFPGIIVVSLFPAIIKAREINFSLYNKRIKHLYSLFCIFSIIVIVAIFLLAKHIILLLFGQEYYLSVNILRVHILALPFICFMRVAGHSLIAEHKQFYLLLTLLLSALVNFGLNMLLIPKWAGMGAAVSTVVSYAIAGMFGFVLFKPSRHIIMQQVRAIMSPLCIREIYEMYIKK